MSRYRRSGLMLLMMLALLAVWRAPLALAGPRIHDLDIVTPGAILRYAPYEIAFQLDTVATNPYLPYDAAPPPGVPAGVGVSVEMLILPPGQIDWDQALTLPCFWYQPVVETGAGDEATLLPSGAAQWRARYTPEQVGHYSYRLQVTDAGGVTLSDLYGFDVVASELAGFCRVGQRDARFFELSDGTPLLSPLVNLEQGEPLNSLVGVRQTIPRLAANGLRFVRWFPTGEGANYCLAPYGSETRIAWNFGAASGVTTSQPDVAQAKLFSFQPYYYSFQTLPSVPDARYRLTVRAQAEGDQVLRIELGGMAQLDVGGTGSAYHEGLGYQCDYRQDGWQSYVLEGVAQETDLTVALRGLYVDGDAQSPYNVVRPGAIRIGEVVLQRDETGDGGWGGNLLMRGDADTYNVVDQRSAALLDEVLSLSAEQGVYHKLPLFDKNDRVLNSFEPDGSVGAEWDEVNERFYSQPGQAARWYEMAYVRYFVARWSYSTALHSLELANENHLTTASYQAGWDLAAYVQAVSPRHIMMSNSFWGWFVSEFFQDATYGSLLDYADQHWYASQEETTAPLISNHWDDSAAYVREAVFGFEQTGYASGPIVRGEGGVAVQHTFPQHPDIATEPQGVYYHKKAWAHVGALGWSMDGEWYPRLFASEVADQFPNAERNTWDIYAAYDRFVRDEPLNNGRYLGVGDDLGDAEAVLLTTTQGRLRAWGVRDAAEGRALLWIDNANHTWLHVAQGDSIEPASGNVLVQGLPPGDYEVAWWDTISGSETHRTEHQVNADGMLALTVSALAEDVACKIIRVGGVGSMPVEQPLALNAGWNLVSLACQPQDADIAALLAPIASSCDVAWAYDAGDPADPWRSYAPTVPDYANDLTQVDITQGMWLHMDAPADLMILGVTDDADVPLQPGWNLVGYPRVGALPIAEAIASISEQVMCVYGYQQDPVEDGWQVWAATLPPGECNLTQIESGRGYWIKVSGACVWQLP